VQNKIGCRRCRCRRDWQSCEGEFVAAAAALVNCGSLSSAGDDVYLIVPQSLKKLHLLQVRMIANSHFADSAADSADADGYVSAESAERDMLCISTVCHRFVGKCETFVRTFVSILREIDNVRLEN
jgi:hypothetical protein